MQLVTFAKLDDVFDIDPLFVKLFRVAQYTIEYLLHSQEYLKNTIANFEKKIAVENAKTAAANAETEKVKKLNIYLKKENKKRRQMGA